MVIFIDAYNLHISSLQILKTHPDVNVANEHGNTPLHYAAFWNYIGICEVLSITHVTSAIVMTYNRCWSRMVDSL